MYVQLLLDNRRWIERIIYSEVICISKQKSPQSFCKFNSVLQSVLNGDNCMPMKTFMPLCLPISIFVVRKLYTDPAMAGTTVVNMKIIINYASEWYSCDKYAEIMVFAGSK